MEQESQTPDTTTDTLEDIDPCFHEVVRKYGRPMFALLMQAGMAGQAAIALGQIQAAMSQSPNQRFNKLAASMAHAVTVVCSAFNELSNEYVRLQAWPEELVAQCDRDIQLAYAGKVKEAPTGLIVH